MPLIGWVFIALSVALILGALFMLRDSANTMKLSDDKREKIRKRQAELEEEEGKDDWDD